MTLKEAQEGRNFYKKQIREAKIGIVVMLIAFIFIIFAVIAVVFASDKPVLGCIFIVPTIQLIGTFINAIQTIKNFEPDVRFYETKINRILEKKNEEIC